MNRLAWVLTALVAVLVVVLWWFLLWSPTSEEIDQVRADTEDTRSQTQQQRAEEARLRRVRESAPEAEAELAASRVLVPTGTELPALLRHVQQAADESGARLVSIAPARPAEVADVPGGLAGVQVNFTVEATYFQLIDLARRLEDPEITARGLVWRNASFSISEFPVLNASLSAEVFSRIADAPEVAAEDPPEAPDDGDDREPGEPVPPTVDDPPAGEEDEGL